MDSNQIAEIEQKFPGRLQHIHLLSRLLNPSLPSPPSLFLHDVNSPSRTFSLLSSVLDQLIKQSIDHNQETADQIAIDSSETLPHRRSSLHKMISINLSPLTHPTPRAIYSQILNDVNATCQKSDLSTSMLSEYPTSSKGPPHLVPVDDSIGAFVRSLRLALERVEVAEAGTSFRNGISYQKLQPRQCKLVLTVRDAERIRDMWHEHVCEGLGKLGELLDRQGLATLILVSSIPPSQFRTAAGGFNASSTLPSPLVIRFQGIGTEPTLRTLHLLFPQLEKSFEIQSRLYPESSVRKKYSSDQAFSSALRKLFEGLCKYVCDNFSTEIRSIDEKEVLTSALWHVLSVVVHLGVVSDLNFSRYATYLRPFGRDALNVLIPRRLGIREWIIVSRSEMTELVMKKNPAIRSRLEDFNTELREVNENNRVGDKRSRDENSLVKIREREHKRLRAAKDSSVINLPLLPSYLLIAAFLASFLKASKDASLFLRSNEGMAGNVKRGGGAKKSIKGVGEEEEREDLKRASLVGPKPFPLERLFAILQSILSENSPNSTGSNLKYTFEFEEDFGKEDEEMMGDWRSKMEKWSSADQAEEIWGRRIRSASTLKTISILISRRLIQRTSATEKLDSVKLRCNIGYAEARLLSNRVGFELDNYMSSW